MRRAGNKLGNSVRREYRKRFGSCRTDRKKELRHVQERWIAAGRARGSRRSDVFFRPSEVEFGSFAGPALRSSGSRGRGQNCRNGSTAGNLKTRTGSSGAYAGEASVRFSVLF